MKTIVKGSGFGIALKRNPYGGDFDAAAKKRMMEGSMQLMPLLEKRRGKLGANVLEIGPFNDPLVTKERFPHIRNIFYCDVDPKITAALERMYPDTVPICADASTQDVLEKISKLMAIEVELNLNVALKDGKICIKPMYVGEKIPRNAASVIEWFKGRFDSIVISQVLNYVDYKSMLCAARDLLEKNGLLFINNVAEHGIPKLFSRKRPRSIEETLQAVKMAGFAVVEKQVLEPLHPQHQKQERLVLVAKKTKN